MAQRITFFHRNTVANGSALDMDKLLYVLLSLKLVNECSPVRRVGLVPAMSIGAVRLCFSLGEYARVVRLTGISYVKTLCKHLINLTTICGACFCIDTGSCFCTPSRVG